MLVVIHSDRRLYVFSKEGERAYADTLGNDAQDNRCESAPWTLRICSFAQAPGDCDQVFELNAQAFETDAEARLVSMIGQGEARITSLVAVRRGRVVGHILFTPVQLEPPAKEVFTVALGPMAVHPEFQRQGIGVKLVRAGIAACKPLGVDAIFVLGHVGYYPRFGFQPAAPLGFCFRSTKFDPYFMVFELSHGVLEGLAGEVRYLAHFDDV